MANDRGHMLNRTSYDARQEINAKVIGILQKNNKIREELIKRNLGKYPMWDGEVTIGAVSPIFQNVNNPGFRLDGNGLLGYTHLNDEPFAKNINQRYGFGDEIEIYQGGSLPSVNHRNWGGKYDDYSKYLEDVYGLNYTSINFLADSLKVDKLSEYVNIEHDRDRALTIQSILQDFLKYDEIGYAMEKTRIGVVNPNPLAALDGAVTTNINNFSGTDTPLGLISNHMYAHTLRNGAQFNSLRHVEYISDGVYENLGNKLSTLPYLASMGKIDPETGRLAYEYGEGQGTISYEGMTPDEFAQINLIDGTKDLSSSKNARYRNLIRNLDKYAPFDGYQYGNLPAHPIVKGFMTTTFLAKSQMYWNEGDKGNWSENIVYTNDNTAYTSLDGELNDNTLIAKTKELFERHDEKGIDSLIGRFHTTGGRDTLHNEVSLMQTAVSKFGMSHGRNLLTKKAYTDGVADKINGYSNPYCRTWTYHHQYDSVNKLIRPFSETSSNGTVTAIGIDELQQNWWKYGRRAGSAGRLKDHSSLNKNGFVNITPTGGGDKKGVDIKQCMFSIENLAWKDVNPNEGNYNDGHKHHHGALSKEQQGPNGGRIMWFPPYNLSFNENINVNWQQNEFIGRGEKIYTYANTERGGTLSFTLLVDHPSILDMWKKNGAGADQFDNEQQVLRFFAGCDTLELNNLQTGQSNETINNDNEKVVDIPFGESSVNRKMIFYVFYPNNFSGKGRNTGDNVTYLTQNYESKSPKDIVYEGYKWKYYVDDDYIDQKLRYESNYANTNGLELNANLSKVTKDQDFADATISFERFINENLDYVKHINSITVEGYASSHGYDDINAQELSLNRGKTAKEMVISKLGPKIISKMQPIKHYVIQVSPEDLQNVSGESAKRGRYAKVTIVYNTFESIQKMDAITPSTETTSQLINRSIEIDENSLTKAQRRALRKAEREIKKSVKDKLKDGTKERMEEERRNLMQQKISEDSQKSVAQLDGMIRNSKIVSGKKLLTNDEIKAGQIERRWDDEAQYFEMLETNNSIIYSRIMDKVKYFNPAYHSITPEGFNARLAFLHQCTRQGHTIGASDGSFAVKNNMSNGNGTTKEYRSSGNMAFGRPPICVLRIGDFYNTRIIINSITIDYENPQWDMNPEGIGIQPMYAKISLNFMFLGGSDLEAPISRLQNAVSFNYYANQSVYDDRADIGIYDNGKAKISGKPWMPTSTFEKKS